jgi:hypothetical protein
MPPVLRYKIVGTDRLLSILERVAFGSEASADAVLEVAAPRVAARSAQLAPRRTGVLAGSIRAEKARELIREACDDPSMKYQDAEWMDVWPALVTVLKRRTDTKFSYDQAADMKYDDIVKPPEEKPKKLSEVKHPQQVSS